MYIKLITFFIISPIFLFTACNQKTNQPPERTILFIIDGMTPGINDSIHMPNFSSLLSEGVLFREVYLPLAAHPDSSTEYPWTSSIPNPVLMSGTVFIGQEGIRKNLLQHSFTNRPTAFLVNAGAYSSISDDYTIYMEFQNVFNDEQVIKSAREVIVNNNPEFIRIHCQGPGSAGFRSQKELNQPYTHNIWHETSPYRTQNTYVDSLLGDFIQWMKEKDIFENSVIIIIGDHGQSDMGGHLPDDPSAAVTQALFIGKDIRKGIAYDFAEITDIAPTITWLHQLPPPKYNIGRVLKEIKYETDQSGEPEKLIKELNNVLVEYFSIPDEQKTSDFLSIFEIGKWHLSPSGTDLRSFVEQQKRSLETLKQNPNATP